MTNSVDPDETAHYEPSHLDLHCLQKHLSWSTRLKGLACSQIIIVCLIFLLLSRGVARNFIKIKPASK